MARESFKDINIKGGTRLLIQHCLAIIEELEALGYRLTLRQLFYQLVSRDIIANKQKEYKRLGEVISNARLCGLVDWDSIEDRTRRIREVPHWTTPEDIIKSAADSYRIDKWIDQPYQIEVWVEKDALVGIVEKACAPLDVKWFSCRGYGSQTALYDAGKRIVRHLCNGKEPLIIHLGDHDPSGVQMTEDIYERLFMFAGQEIEVHRIALNMDQVNRYHPPENPAKETDSRFAKYEAKYGNECWELDALSPQVVEQLIIDEIMLYRDEDLYQVQVAREEKEREALADAAARWLELQDLLTMRPDEMTEFIASKVRFEEMLRKHPKRSSIKSKKKK